MAGKVFAWSCVPYVWFFLTNYSQMYHRIKMHGTTKHLSIVLDFRLLAQKFLTHSGFAAMALQQWSRAFWEHQTWSDKWRALAFFQASLMETLIMNVVFGGLRLAGWSGSAHICLWWWDNQAGPIIQAMQGWWVQYWSACKEGHCKQVSVQKRKEDHRRDPAMMFFELGKWVCFSVCKPQSERGEN